MKSPCLLVVLGHSLCLVRAGAAVAAARTHSLEAVSPLQKVVTLLNELEAKLKRDAEQELKAYQEFTEWCSTSARDKEYEIKTAKTSIEDLTAGIQKAEADLAAGAAKVEELAAAISTNDGDLQAATKVRKKEEQDFGSVQAELVEVIDTLDRAITVLERKLRGSTLLQSKVDTQDAAKLAQVLGTVLDAAALSLQDKQRLLALAQSGRATGEDDELSLGAPEAEVYKSHSEGIVEVLEDLREKAEAQLTEVRKQEVNSKHNYQLLKQSLEDQISEDTKDKDEAKANMATTAEEKAAHEGDLHKTQKDLADAESSLAVAQESCTSAAADHEASTKSVAEELQALAEAKRALTENATAAGAVAYSAALLQNSHGGSSAVAAQGGEHGRLETAGFEVVKVVRQLANKEKSPALAQLAGRIQATMSYGLSVGEDPFAKVKALITDMIVKLQEEAGEEASHKAYCDKEMAETKGKSEELSGSLEHISAKIDQKRAASVELKNDVEELNAEVAEILRSQLELDKVRTEEHKVYVQKKADLEQGLRGVRQALQILREYYSSAGASSAASFVQQPAVPQYHSKSTGAGSGIIGLLEVIESDFGRGLAQTEMDEDTAATEYQKVTTQNKVSKAMKDQSLKYKSKEAAELDRDVAQLVSDRESMQAELDAVMDYSKGIHSACVSKPESYEERRSRREAEISGLREALRILEGETVLTQRRSRGTLRGQAVAALHP